jgi:hypothetical protein
MGIGRDFPEGKSDRSMELTTYLEQVPRSKKLELYYNSPHISS